ncbi:MAG: hypothetical protein BGO67_02580 [Alphaproteobacteria bacterium 41-28]|nr:MAG: hypothetical protein BGO67_02580 [Alphaproteobacteria bacterium 41-28]
MNLWNERPVLFGEFLTQHRDLVLYDTFHRIMTFLLYPFRCSCKDLCRCDSVREKILLSLNLDFYHKLQEKNDTPETLFAARFLLKIPEESYFAKHYTNAYPSWLIREGFSQKDIPFKIVDHLMWTLLRLSRTHELSVFHTAKTSMQEAIEWIFGTTPVKTKTGGKKSSKLGGQDAYKKGFKYHKEVSHFITALEFVKRENAGKESLLFSWNEADQIERFLSLSHWFRQKFLLLYTPNATKKEVFLEEEILPLPAWVTSENINVSIEPFEKKLEEINAPYVELINSATT